MSTIRVVNIQHSDATEPNIVLEADGTTVFASGITISGGTNLTVSGTAEFASGTVSAPGITFIDDNNTGIYEPAADTVAITTAATERLRIDSSGKVGVGTSSPNQALHVIGSSANASAGTAYNAARIVGNSYVSTNTGGLTIGAYWNNADVNGRRAYIQSSQGLDAGSTARDLLLNPSGGNVGIGTTSPEQLLHLSSSGNPTLKITSTNDSFSNIYFSDSSGTAGRIEYQHSNDSMQFRTANSEQMRIDSSGNVAIGTTSPQAISGYTVLTLNNASQGGAIEFKNNNTSYGRLLQGSSAVILETKQNIPLIFGTGTSSTERMRIDSSGNIGIGLSSNISSKVHVENGWYQVGQSTNTTQTNFLIKSYGYRLNSSLYGTCSIRSNYTNTTNTADLRFFTADPTEAQRMMISTTGSVGIGVDPPTKGSYFGGTQKVLHVGGSSVPELRLESNASAGKGDLSIFASNSGANSHVYSRGTNGAVNFSTTNSTGTRKDEVFRVLGRGIAMGSASQGLAPSNGSVMFTGYHSGSFRLGFDWFNLNGSAWHTGSLFFFYGSVEGGLTGNTHGMIHIRITGLTAWGVNTSTVIQGGAITITGANGSSNHLDIDFTFNSGMRGPVSFWLQSPNGSIPEITFTA